MSLQLRKVLDSTLICVFPRGISLFDYGICYLKVISYITWVIDYIQSQSGEGGGVNRGPAVILNYLQPKYAKFCVVIAKVSFSRLLNKNDIIITSRTFFIADYIYMYTFTPY